MGKKKSEVTYYKDCDERELFSPAKARYDDPHAIERLSAAIKKIFNTYNDETKYVIVCIGTDRSTGDSLGPLVGTYLKDCNFKNFEVLGNLATPVHAENLVDNLDYIKNNYSGNYVVIAIDACLGQYSNVGDVSLRKGSMIPGAGVKKDLPAVGDFNFIGIVNVGGFMEYFVLQNTRLYVVNEMAKVLSSSIIDAFSWKESQMQETKEEVQEVHQEAKEPKKKKKKMFFMGGFYSF